MVNNIKRIIKDSNEPIHLIIGNENILGIPIKWNNLNNLNITEYNTGIIEVDGMDIQVILSTSIPSNKIYLHGLKEPIHIIL